MNKALASIALSLTLAACSSGDEVVATEPEAEVAVAETVEAEPAQTIVSMPRTLEDVIKTYTPVEMNYFNEFPPVLASFASWNEQVGTSWNELNLIEKTSYGKVMKDPVSEYGKLICTTGSIYEIETDRSMSEPLYHGSIVTDNMEIYRFTAFGSSGELVAQSNTKFCGIVAAKFSFDNTIGGITHAPYLFGMFDLPENK